jgi:uncharacterized oxidoreductase
MFRPVAFVLLAISPVYCAAKAAIHPFTQSLRLQLKRTTITVFELAPPITETSLFQGDMSMSDINLKPMKVTAFVEHALSSIARSPRDPAWPEHMLKMMQFVAVLESACGRCCRKRFFWQVN